jgi:flagellin
MFRINSNLSGTLVASLNQATSTATSSIERISTGLRINRAVDDPAGLGVSTKLRSMISALGQANQNAETATSLTQTADSGLESIGSILTALDELAVEAADTTIDASTRSGIASEADALISEIDRIAAATSFGGTSLLAASSNLTFFIGDGTAGSDDEISLTLSNAAASQFIDGVTSTNLAASGNTAVITSLDLGITSVSLQRSGVGAVQSRLEAIQTDIGTKILNLQGADSAIRDADIAFEASAIVRAQILTQTSVFGIAQLAKLNQNVLALFPTGASRRSA